MTRRAARLGMALVAAVAGCASVQAKRARSEQLTRALDELRYARPLDEVWSQARRLLSDKGYPLVGEDAAAVGRSGGFLARLFSPAKETFRDEGGALVLQTGWSRGRDRYRLEAREDERGTRVVMTRVVEDLPDHRDKASRGLEMELELVRRVDPEAAARIEASLPGPHAGRSDEAKETSRGYNPG
jgi:hypothetical protein